MKLVLYRRAGFIFAVESAGKILLLGTTFVAASVLSATEFAKFGAFLAMQQFVTLLAQGGIAESVIGEISSEKELNKSNAIYRTAFVGVACSSFIAAAAVLVWAFFLSPLNGFRGFVTALSILGGGVTASIVMVKANFLVLDGKTPLSCGLKAVFYICTGVGGLVFINLTKNAEGYFFGTCLLGLPYGYLAWRKSSKSNEMYVEWKALVRLFRRSLPFTGTSLLGWASWSGATLVIYASFDSRMTACYTLLTSLSSLLVFATGAVNQAWQPMMLQSIQGVGLVMDQSRKHLADLLEITLLGGAIALLLIVAVARERSIWFPARYPEMQFLMPFGFVCILANLNYYISVNQFVFFGAGQKLLRLSALSYLVGGVIWVILGYHFGKIGVYAGWGLTQLIRGLVISQYAAVEWSVKTSPLRTFRMIAILLGVSLLLYIYPSVCAWYSHNN